MFYRQQVKAVKRTGEETVKWLDNTDNNYKQHLKKQKTNKKTTLLVYWCYAIYVLLVKIKHLSGQYMSLRRGSSVYNFYKTAVKRQLSDKR